MSFDIHYHTCNLGTRTTRQRNPFTGEVQSVPVGDGLSDAERATVRDMLRAAGADAPDEFGCYAVEVPDGGAAEVFASGLVGPEPCDGFMVSLRGMTPGMARLLWELCRDGNMAATPVMEDEVVVVASEAQLRRVQARWPGAVVVGSPDELGRLLDGGIAAWQAYRNQVAGG
ncbi:hypothetical protein J0H58_01145 [bacterium]|nr:hypothetical protein [bacterium]